MATAFFFLFSLGVLAVGTGLSVLTIRHHWKISKMKKQGASHDNNN